jgi:hypothetical protein
MVDALHGGTPDVRTASAENDYTKKMATASDGCHFFKRLDYSP